MDSEDCSANHFPIGQPTQSPTVRTLLRYCPVGHLETHEFRTATQKVPVALLQSAVPHWHAIPLSTKPLIDVHELGGRFVQLSEAATQ